MVQTGLAALVIGFAFWTHAAQFIDNVYLWILFSLALSYVVVFVASKPSGPTDPSLAGAGRTWAAA